MRGQQLHKMKLHYGVKGCAASLVTDTKSYVVLIPYNNKKFRWHKTLAHLVYLPSLI